jgi:superfamily II DNA or RNA helicase
MKTRAAEITVGRWVTFPQDHPLVPGLRKRMTLPNPEWERNMAMEISNVGVPREIVLYERGDGVWHFPRALVHSLSEANPALEWEDETTLGEAWDISSNITLRAEQVPFVEALLEALQSRYGVVGRADVGFGKTICLLHLLSLLGRKALIVVHKEFLMTQWVERILGTEAAAERLGVPLESFKERYQPALGLRPEQVGIVQQNRCEYEGCGIVIAMAQSLLSRDYPREFYESFGVLEVDEVHRFAAPTFQQTIGMFPARYRIGATATPKRKDGMEDVFYSHIGAIAADGKAVRAAPRISLVRTRVLVTKDQLNALKNYRGKPDYVKTISWLVQHESRNQQIVELVVRAVQAGRKIIVFSDRRAHLETLREMFRQVCASAGIEAYSDFYVGGMDLAERAAAEKMDVLWSTYAMGEEGLDIPTLDTVVLTTPRNSAIQSVGRGLRIHPDKKQPVVVDLVDFGIPMCKNMAARREREYRAERWM